jgi:hypothetical protein
MRGQAAGADSQRKSHWVQRIQWLLRIGGGTSGGRTHDKRIKSAKLYTTMQCIFNAVQRLQKAVCSVVHCSRRCTQTLKRLKIIST